MFIRAWFWMASDSSLLSVAFILKMRFGGTGCTELSSVFSWNRVLLVAIILSRNSSALEEVKLALREALAMAARSIAALFPSPSMSVLRMRDALCSTFVCLWSSTVELRIVEDVTLAREIT